MIHYWEKHSEPDSQKPTPGSGPFLPQKKKKAMAPTEADNNINY